MISEKEREHTIEEFVFYLRNVQKATALLTGIGNTSSNEFEKWLNYQKKRYLAFKQENSL